MLDINNKEVKKVLDYFSKAGHEVKSVEPINTTPVYLDKDFEDVFGFIQGDHNDWNIEENQTTHIEFTEKKNFMGLGFDTVMSKFTKNYFVIELESDKSKGFIVVKVENGIHKVGKGINNKARVTNNTHNVVYVGFGKKEFVDSFGEYNTFNKTEWNKLTKFALNLENRL